MTTEELAKAVHALAEISRSFGEDPDAAAAFMGMAHVLRVAFVAIRVGDALPRTGIHQMLQAECERIDAWTAAGMEPRAPMKAVIQYVQFLLREPDIPLH